MRYLKSRAAVRTLALLALCALMPGCAGKTEELALNPLPKRGEFYTAVDSEGSTFYVDYDGGTLSVIGPGRMALEKYTCESPELLAAAFGTAEILAAGRDACGKDGIALGNLYITADEIIVFHFTSLEIMERLTLKMTGVTRIGNYDDFADKLNLLWEAVNDAAEYRVTVDAKENPVLYKEDRIIYFEGGQVYLKNVTDLRGKPVGFKAFYESFVQDQERIGFLTRGNGLYGYTCLVFEDSLCFISDTGQLSFGREDI